MAKLVGHYFDCNKRKFITIEIANLKETDKQYAKTKETTGDTSIVSEYWAIMPKARIDEVHCPYSLYSMYSLQEDLPRFKALVMEDLQIKADHKLKAYNEALATLEAARNG